MGEPKRTFHDKLYRVSEKTRGLGNAETRRMDIPPKISLTQLQQPQMLASLIASTVVYAVARGIPMEQITAVTGLTRTDLIDPDARLPQEVVPAVWRLLGKAYPGEALALEMASAAPFSYFGPVVHAAKYAKDLRSSLQTLIRYRSLMSDQLHMALVETPLEATLQMYHPMDAEDGGYAAEVGIALGSRFGKEFIEGEHALIRVDFSHQPFGPIQVYEDFFGTPVKFGQPWNAMVFDSEALDQPTQQQDAHLFRYIQGHLDLVREQLAVSSDSSELAKIREAIADNAERSEYSAEALAQKLHLSLRALQRLTQEYGITIRQLLDEARQANAQQFLSDPRLSIEAISFLLGYSEDRAFRRAFKRWTGQTPAQFRQTLRVRC
ncbi:MAG: AraC family transcriptional regulator [Symploca sp. SIO2E6]|nr:AraC family transcriptional regulator [Symploca sp. SIO2E6]